MIRVFLRFRPGSLHAGLLEAGTVFRRESCVVLPAGRKLDRIAGRTFRRATALLLYHAYARKLKKKKISAGFGPRLQLGLNQ